MTPLPQTVVSGLVNDKAQRRAFAAKANDNLQLRRKQSRDKKASSCA